MLRLSLSLPPYAAQATAAPAAAAVRTSLCSTLHRQRPAAPAHRANLQGVCAQTHSAPEGQALMLARALVLVVRRDTLMMHACTHTHTHQQVTTAVLCTSTATALATNLAGMVCGALVDSVLVSQCVQFRSTTQPTSDKLFTPRLCCRGWAMCRWCKLNGSLWFWQACASRSCCRASQQTTGRALVLELCETSCTPTRTSVSALAAGSSTVVAPHTIAHYTTTRPQ